MAIALNPITLPASKMLSTITALIGEVRMADTLGTSEIVTDLVNSCRIGKVDFGKGIVYTFKTDVQPVSDLSETSTAFKITKPNVAQERISIDQYKFTSLSLSEVLSRDAFLNGEAVNTFLSFVQDLLQTTSEFHLYDVCNKLYQDWTPAQATQTIEVNQIDTSTLKGADLVASLTYNANQICTTLRKLANNMMVPSSKYTDAKTYVDANDGQTKNVKSALKSKSELKVTFNDNYYTEIIANSLATLYHGEKLGEMIPGDNLVIIPTESMASKNAKTICWVSSKMKFALADFYTVVLSILDPSTMYTNTFYHFAYGAGVFTYAPGVKLVAKVVSPAVAAAASNI